MSIELEGLKQKALKVANSSSDLASLEKAASIAKLVSETEKLLSDKLKAEADISSIRRNERFESARLWLPISVPFLSTIILAGTLIFQIRQFSVTTKMQKDSAEETRKIQTKAAEDAQWTEAIKTLAEAKTPESTLAGVTFLRSFMRSPTYQVPARELAFHYLIQTQNTDSFKPMFNAVMDIPTWDNLADYIQVNRLLAGAYDLAYVQINNVDADRSKLKTKSSVSKAVLQKQADQIYQDLSLTSAHIASIMRTPRPNNIHLDLSGTSLFNGADFRRANFQGANLSKTVLGCVVDGADFTKIEDFELSLWKYTAWWRAERIDAALLKYLTERYPFTENIDYSVVTDLSDYKSNVDRLLAATQQK
jgi:uncharacterized protein YjbI with pentapeptide repeats